MYNKLCDFIRTYDMIRPGERIICAVSGGADSMALLWGLYLLKEKLEFTLEAAHFNHQLRAEASDRDAAFVESFCHRFDIPLHMGTAPVQKGKKGLEAAAREARYGYFRTLGGKIATAHTADDNAETVLLNLVRGTGLKGLGAIAPVGEKLIRPMLSVTRTEVLEFLEEYHIPHVEDATNAENDFLRNRLRHDVLPLLRRENPRLSENLSAMAQRLRQDAEILESLTQKAYTDDVYALRQLEKPLRSRILEKLLKENGVREPTARHMALAEALVFSENPSARAAFPGGVTMTRCYGKLKRLEESAPLLEREVQIPGVTPLPELGLRLVCRLAEEVCNTKHIFTLQPQGKVVLRCRKAGDEMRLPGGTKSLKKAFVDAKIPAAERLSLPVLADDAGILAVYGLGADQNRKAQTLPAMQFVFEKEI